MSDETQDPQNERRPSHLTDDGAEVEGHVIKSHLTDDGADESERRPSHLTDDEPEVEGHVIKYRPPPSAFEFRPSWRGPN